MIDRFGRRISVGWPEHHLEWIKAAITLDYKARQEAFKDIADMTGRGLKNVRECAKRIREMDKRHVEQRQRIRTPAHWSLPPSQLRKPTMAQLMGCR